VLIRNFVLTEGPWEAYDLAVCVEYTMASGPIRAPMAYAADSALLLSELKEAGAAAGVVEQNDALRQLRERLGGQKTQEILLKLRNSALSQG